MVACCGHGLSARPDQVQEAAVVGSCPQSAASLLQHAGWLQAGALSVKPELQVAGGCLVAGWIISDETVDKGGPACLQNVYTPKPDLNTQVTHLYNCNFQPRLGWIYHCNGPHQSHQWQFHPTLGLRHQGVCRLSF